jgi:hypothetical protein
MTETKLLGISYNFGVFERSEFHKLLTFLDHLKHLLWALGSLHKESVGRTLTQSAYIDKDSSCLGSQMVSHVITPL